MALPVFGSNNTNLSEEIMKGVYIGKNLIKEVVDVSLQADTYGKTYDVAIQLGLQPEGKDWITNKIIGGNFKRDEQQGGVAIGWGGVTGIMKLLQELEVAPTNKEDWAALNESLEKGKVPEYILKALVGKEVYAIQYVSDDKKDNGKSVYYTFKKFGMYQFSIDKDKLANSFRDTLAKGDLTKYSPTLLENGSTDFSFGANVNEPAMETLQV